MKRLLSIISPPQQVLLVHDLHRRRRRREDGFDDVDFEDDEDDFTDDGDDEVGEDAEASVRKGQPPPLPSCANKAAASNHQWWSVLERFFRGIDAAEEGEEGGGGGGDGLRGWRRMKMLHDRLAAAASTEATMHI